MGVMVMNKNILLSNLPTNLQISYDLQKISVDTSEVPFNTIRLCVEKFDILHFWLFRETNKYLIDKGYEFGISIFENEGIVCFVDRDKKYTQKKFNSIYNDLKKHYDDIIHRTIMTCILMSMQAKDKNELDDLVKEVLKQFKEISN
jgi:hypothetical protein